VSVRWLFGDQLGPHFTDDLAGDDPVLLVESRRVFARRRFHRAKAHLVLSAMRHRAAELGDRCTYAQVGTYAEALDGVPAPTTVAHPTSHAALRFARGDATPLPGFDQDPYIATGDFNRLPLADWAAEYEAVRTTSLLLFDRLTPEAWDRSGVASENVMSVRALAYCVVGHERHHVGILRKRLS